MTRVVLRGLLARRLRLVLTSLAIALGIMLITGSYVFTDTFTRGLDKVFQVAQQGNDVVVTPHQEFQIQDGSQPPALDARFLDRVKAVPGVAEAEGGIFDQSGTLLDATGKPFESQSGAPQFVGSTATVERFNAFDYAQGRSPQNAGEVAVDKGLADDKGIEVGDIVGVQAQAPRRNYRVVGIVQIAGVDSLGGASVALLTMPEAQRITGKVGKFDSISVAAEPGVADKQLADRVDAALPATLDVRTGAEEADKQSSDIRDNISPLTTALLVFAAIALFVGAFLIFNTFSITVAQRTRELALLRMLGASRKQIRRSVLAEGLTMGVIGSAIGLGLGMLAALGLRALFNLIGANFPSDNLVLLPRTVIVSMGVGTVVTLLASLAPAIRATRIAPVAALQSVSGVPAATGLGKRVVLAAILGLAGLVLILLGLFAISDTSGALIAVGIGAVAMFLGIALFSPQLVRPIASVVGRPLERFGGLPGRLARENSTRQPTRTATTAAALMIGVTFVTFALFFAASANETIGKSIDNHIEAQAVIQNTDGFSTISSGAALAASNAPGVATVSAMRMSQGRLTGGDKVQVTGVDPSSFQSQYSFNVVDGPEDAVRGLGPGRAILDSAFAEDNGLKIGDRIAMTTPTGSNVNLSVIALADDNPAGFTGKVTVSNAVIDRSFGATRDQFVFVSYDASVRDVDTATKQLDTSLSKRFPESETLTSQQFKQKTQDQVNQFLAIIFALLALAIVVAVFGIVNTLVLAITERTRELGLLRAIGTSRRQVRRMVRYESVITALIGTVIGTVVGSLLAILVLQKVEEIAFAVPVTLLVIVLILGAIVGVFAAIWPARRASRLDVLQSLAYE